MRIARHLLTIFALAGTLAAIPPALAASEATKAAPAKNLAADPNAKDLILKGDAKCTGCHDEADEPTGRSTMLELNPGVLAIGKTKHGTQADSRTPTCTDCHGESEKHRLHKGSDKPPQVDRSFRKKTTTSVQARNEEACLTCHQRGNQINWQASTHGNRDLTCSTCHKIHSKYDAVRDRSAQTEICFTCHKEQRAQMHRQSRHPVPEGKMGCSSCHNLHGDNPKQLVRSNTNETCYQCHMEKRGPFLNNHQPVNEDCGLCHNPHGSTNTPMLKARSPMICQECHNEVATGHPGQRNFLPAAPTTTTSQLGSVGRGCLNCHTSIHGDNNPQGATATRRFFR